MTLLAKTGKKRFGNRKKRFATPEHIKVEMAVKQCYQGAGYVSHTKEKNEM